ncbi:TPA: hypothetical protein ACGR3Y_004821, partial [Enterobacter asburiae]
MAVAQKLIILQNDFLYSNNGLEHMNKLMLIALTASALAGCTSQAQRMADCEAQGISLDAC